MPNLKTGFNLFSGTYKGGLYDLDLTNDHSIDYETSIYYPDKGLHITGVGSGFTISTILPDPRLNTYHSIKYAIELAKYSYLNKKAVVCLCNCGASIEAIMRTEEYYKVVDWFRYYQINDDGKLVDCNGKDGMGISNKIKLFEPICEANQRLIFEGINNY
jgi:hypothetical protein